MKSKLSSLMVVAAAEQAQKWPLGSDHRGIGFEDTNCGKVDYRPAPGVRPCLQ